MVKFYVMSSILISDKKEGIILRNIILSILKYMYLCSILFWFQYQIAFFTKSNIEVASFRFLSTKQITTSKWNMLSNTWKYKNDWIELRIIRMEQLMWLEIYWVLLLSCVDVCFFIYRKGVNLFGIFML